MKAMITIALLICTIQAYTQSDTIPLGVRFKASAAVPDKSDFLQVWRMPDGTTRMPLLASKFIQLLPLDGKPTWALIQHYHKEKAVDSDTTFFDEHSLKPLAYRTNLPSEGYREDVSFTKDVITVKVQYKDSIKVFTHNTKGEYIQSTMMDYLISKLPLKEQYRASFRSVNAGLHFDDIITTITVLNKENILAAHNITIPCWKIEVITGRSKSFQWYSVEGQSLMKLEFGSKEHMLFVKSRLL